MKELIFSLFSSLGQRLALLLLVGTTAITTGTAVSKLISRPSSSRAAEKTETAAEPSTTVPEGVEAPVEGGSPVENQPSLTPAATAAASEVVPAPADQTVTPTTTPTATVTAFPPAPSVTRFEDGDDREDKEHEERYRDETEIENER